MKGCKLHDTFHICIKQPAGSATVTQWPINCKDTQTYNLAAAQNVGGGTK